MKSLKLIIVLLATLLSCSSQNDPKQDSIIGQWQLVAEKYDDVIGESGWGNVENGHYIKFSQNLNYSSEGPEICINNPSNIGTYSINSINEKLYVKIILECSQMETGYFEMEYLFRFKNSFLILSPTFSCEEGCSFRYQKIK
jgi:Lipocalin-like domain